MLRLLLVVASIADANGRSLTKLKKPSTDEFLHTGLSESTSNKGAFLHMQDISTGARIDTRATHLDNHSEFEAASSWANAEEHCAGGHMWPPWVCVTALIGCLGLAFAMQWLIWDWACEIPKPDEKEDLMTSIKLTAVEKKDEAVQEAAPVVDPVSGAAPVSDESTRQNDEAAPALDSSDSVRHQIPWQQFVALGHWFCLLIAGAALVRLVCHLNIPRDCHDRVDAIRGLDSLDRLLKEGFIIAILTGVPQRERFRYLYDLRLDSWCRGIIFIVVFLGTGVVWGSLDLIPALSRFSLTTGGAKSIMFNVLLALLVLAALTLVGFHLYWAFRYNSPAAGATYVVSRAIVWVMYGLYFWQANEDSYATFHLHHYCVGYMIAILAEFNHPISMLLLAIGTGIFTQGLSAYAADPLIEHRSQWS
jgi:hypothetical protein